MTIQELCVKYGTDKTPEIGHCYAPIYDRLFKDLEVSNILEIGIGYKGLMGRYVEHYQPGASLRVWRDYFPNAMVYGIDNHIEAKLTGEVRMITLIGSSTDPDWVATLGLPKMDIIIDDGSHRSHDQSATAEHFLPFLKEGGLYFIEDVPSAGYIRRAFPGRQLEILNDVRGDRLVLVK